MVFDFESYRVKTPKSRMKGFHYRSKPIKLPDKLIYKVPIFGGLQSSVDYLKAYQTRGFSLARNPKRSKKLH